ncbi:MAG: class I SAM-dependent methyltransferase [Bacteroidales bacterium]|nr:class I SAM-dependent methyltransferase [Bacteroidales bacterium]
MAETEAYYNQIAEKYQKRFTTGYLGKLRKKERIVVYEFLSPQPGECILDAGCGTGFDAVPLMQKGCIVYGIDLSKGMVNIAKQRGVNAVTANIEEFNLDKKFDKITSSGVMEFCRQHEQIFKNFNNHLNFDGIAVVHFPYKSLSGYVYLLYHRILNSIRIKLFNPRELMNLAEKTGFKVMGFKKAHGFIAVLKLQKISEL